jgi:hypothetical protein
VSYPQSAPPPNQWDKELVGIARQLRAMIAVGLVLLVIAVAECLPTFIYQLMYWKAVLSASH